MASQSVKLGERTGRASALIISVGLLLIILTPVFIYSYRSDLYQLSFITYGAAPALDSSKVQVQRGTLKKRLLLDGELRAVRSRTIYGTTPEDVKIVYLPPEGTIVKAGDRLVELDSGMVLTKIKENEEKIVAADSEIVRSRAQHEAMLRDLEVELSRLWLAYEQSKLKAKIPAEVLARREFQEAQLALEKAKTEYENQLKKIEQKQKEQAAELQVKIIDRDKLKVQLDRDKGNLDGMLIKAPSDGMVIYNDHWMERRKLQIGDLVWIGWPIVRLPDLTEMEVYSQVNEVDGPKISIGSKTEVRLDTYPDTTITGAVKEISQTAIKASWMAKAKVFRVTISLDRTLMEIMKPGMSAQISVVVSETEPQLLVPRSAVKFDGESISVMRVEGSDVQRPIAITILAADEFHYLVASNGALKEGDRVLAKQNQ